MPGTWRDYIKIEQLPNDYQLIVGAIGLENAIRLSQALSKVPIYLPSPDKLFKPAKTQYILDCYAHACPDNPFNHKRLALETGLSIREIYDIIKSKEENSKQAKLFDDDEED